MATDLYELKISLRNCSCEADLKLLSTLISRDAKYIKLDFLMGTISRIGHISLIRQISPGNEKMWLNKPRLFHFV